VYEIIVYGFWLTGIEHKILELYRLDNLIEFELYPVLIHKHRTGARLAIISDIKYLFLDSWLLSVKPNNS
jgi:hypothetical protein